MPHRGGGGGGSKPSKPVAPNVVVNGPTILDERQKQLLERQRQLVRLVTLAVVVVTLALVLAARILRADSSPLEPAMRSLSWEQVTGDGGGGGGGGSGSGGGSGGRGGYREDAEGHGGAVNIVNPVDP
jgi:hypothetical protein